MPDAPKVDGYIWRAEVKRGLNANRRARSDLTRISQLLGSDPELNKYLARLALAIAEEQDAFMALKEIVNGSKE